MTQRWHALLTSCSYKDSLSQVCRNDRDTIVVIATKHVDELQNLPGEIFSSSKAVYAVRRHSCSTFIDIVRLLVGLEIRF